MVGLQPFPNELAAGDPVSARRTPKYLAIDTLNSQPFASIVIPLEWGNMGQQHHVSYSNVMAHLSTLLQLSRYTRSHGSTCALKNSTSKDSAFTLSA